MGFSKGRKETRRAYQRMPQNVYCRWNFSEVDIGGRWSWKNVSSEEFDVIREKMADFRTLTREKLERQTHSHPIRINRFCDEAQNRLKDIKGTDWVDDVEHLFSFEITQKARLWTVEKGLSQKQYIYRILWWDPEHTVCPVKRNRKNRK